MTEPYETYRQLAVKFAEKAEINKALYEQGQREAVERYGEVGKFRWDNMVQCKDLVSDRRDYIRQSVMYGILAILVREEC